MCIFHSWSQGAFMTIQAKLRGNGTQWQSHNNKHREGMEWWNTKGTSFDIIDLSLSTGKLQCCGFSPTVTLWLRHYLLGSKQSLFNGSYSNWKVMDYRFPRGSCLGPLLYFSFTNDLFLWVKTQLSMQIRPPYTVPPHVSKYCPNRCEQVGWIQQTGSECLQYDVYCVGTWRNVDQWSSSKIGNKKH